MTSDPRYITSVDLNPYLVDKTTGLPLSGGTIEFWKDDDRNTPKAVYRLTGAPPNYTYTELPNPVPISSVGTVVDDDGANVALYYFPYSDTSPDADVEPYYVIAKNAGGVIQFTREGWPNTTATSGANAGQASAIVNQLSNPQFVQVNFNADETLVVSFTGADTETIDLAPNWSLEITHTGSGTVEVTRTAISGISQYPTNPPFELSFLAGTNITSLKLIQRLNQNPNIWAPATGATNGFVAFNAVLAELSAITVDYAPSTGAAQEIFNANNTSGLYAQFSVTTQLEAASNTNTGEDGFIDIVVNLAPTGTTTLTSLQIVSLENEVLGIDYEQATVNRQLDQLFHYYNPLLQAKQVDSYLVGWDFPVNPAQIRGETVATLSGGANSSHYIWDQTLVYQTLADTASTSRTSEGYFRLTSTKTAQVAIVQYVDQPTARQLLSQPFAVNVSAASSIDGLVGNVSVFYTSGGTLPNAASSLSLVSGISATGKPTAGNGTWTEVPRRNLGDANFALTTSITDTGFKGWDMNNSADIATANFVAIVVGFAEFNSADTITINSVSLVPGEIPCRPAPKTADEVIMQCRRFYEKSYLANVVAGTVTPVGVQIAPMASTLRDVNNNVSVIQAGFTINYRTPKRVNAPIVTIYSDVSGATGQVRSYIRYGADNDSATIAITSWTLTGASANSVSYAPSAGGHELGPSVTAAADNIPASAWIQYHYLIDARLGII